MALKASCTYNNSSMQIVSTRHEYPLHLGVTEAGTPKAGTVKSAVGIGNLAKGIGDTIRVLTPEILARNSCGNTYIEIVGFENGESTLFHARPAEGELTLYLAER